VFWRRRRTRSSRPATAREQLDEAYVLGRIDEGEYQRKRAVLEGTVAVNEALRPRRVRSRPAVRAAASRTNKKIED
jgi:hypothetical protein